MIENPQYSIRISSLYAVPANPPEGTVEASAQGNPESPSELQNHQGKVVKVSQEKNEADTPNDSNAKDSKPPSVAGQDSSDTANKFAVNEDRDVDTQSSSRNTDVTPLQVSGAADGPDPERKSELPNDAADEFAVNEDRDVNEDELPKGQDQATSDGTVKTELQEKPELENDKINVSQEKAGRTTGQQRQGQLTTSRCRRSRRRQIGVFNKLGIRPTSHSSRYSRQTPCCRRRRCPRVSSFSCLWRRDGSTRQQRRWYR
ncbi:uncharacterized protein LOC144871862 [Branchiostoma floridae x Branchiostoma japonicum]